jgi:hypothetical protein
MNKIWNSTVFVMMVVFIISCGSNVSENEEPDPINNSPDNGLKELFSITDSNGITVDSSASYSISGNSVTIYSDSSDTQGLTLIFTEINDSQAVAILDTNLMPPEFGGVEIVFERMSGSGETLEDDLWRFDSLRITSDTLGVEGAVPISEDSYLVLNSDNGDVVSTLDTAEMKKELVMSSIAACPMILFNAASGVPVAALVLPLDTLDAARSDCDTSWGYKNGVEVYIVSNGSDSLYVYDADTDVKKETRALSLIVDLVMTLLPGLADSL